MNKNRNGWIAMCVIIVFMLSSFVQTEAGTSTWTGEGQTNRWSESANWSPYSPDNYDTVNFGENTESVVFNDLVDLKLGRIEMDRGGLTLSGNSLSLIGVGTGQIVLTPGNSGESQISVNSINLGFGGAHLSLGSGLSILSDISGSGPVLKTGYGDLTLKGNNTFIGGLTFSGRLAVSSDHNLGYSKEKLYFQGNGTELMAMSDFTSDRPIVLLPNSNNPPTSIVNTLENDVELKGVISGGSPFGLLEKRGFGVLTFSGKNSYLGETHVVQGILRTGVNEAIPDDSLVEIFEGATLDLNGNRETINNLYSNNISETTSVPLICLGTGTLIVNKGSFDGDISGSGSLVKNGSDTFYLNGTSSYSGGTVVNGGELFLRGNETIQGDIVNNAQVSMGVGGSHHYDGVLSGTGILTLRYGELFLSGRNTFSGTTQINYGSILRGDTASLSGNILLHGGRLQFDQESDGVFLGNINTDGTGQVNKYGQGILRLTGTNSLYAFVEEGMLEGNSNSLRGSIKNNSVVSFDQDFNGTYAGRMDGTGHLVKTGGGILNLTGSNSYSGGTTVNEGKLAVTRFSLGTGEVFLNGGGLLFEQRDFFNSTLNLVGVGGSLDTGGNDVVFSGIFRGSGGLVKMGTGTLTLDGTSMYTGSTTVSEGTLLGTTNSLQGEIVNNTRVIFNQSTDGTYAGAMSGTGVLAKTGEGTLTLSGVNNHSGGTLVAGGILSVSGNENLGTGNLVLDGGAIRFGTETAIDNFVEIGSGNGEVNTSGYTGALSGVLSGTGRLTKTGTGLLSLTGLSHYTGGTTVSAGTLQGNSQSLQGAIINNSSVVFNQETDGTYSGNMGGAGRLGKVGAGILNLSGTNTFSGGTTIEEGTLTVGSAGGLGTGNVTVKAGTLCSADGPRDINVGGNYTQTGGDLVLQIEATKHDRLVVSGNANLGGHLSLFGGFVPGLGSSVTIVDAVNRFGTFDDVTIGFPGMDGGVAVSLGLVYNPTSVVLTASQLPYANFTGTENQGAVAGALDAVSAEPTGDMATLVGELNTLTADGLQAGMNSLSPQKYQVLPTMGLAGAGHSAQQIQTHLAGLRGGGSGVRAYAQNAVNERYGSLTAAAGTRDDGLGTGSEKERPWGGFVMGTGMSGKVNGDENQSGSSYHSSGFLLGLDRWWTPAFTGGVSLGYSQGSGDMGGGSTAETKSLTPGLYGSYNFGTYYVTGLGAWQVDDYAMERRVVVGALDRTATANTNGGTKVMAVEVGRPVAWKKWRMTPVAGFQWSRFETDGFTESGAGAASLAVEKTTQGSMISSLGWRAGREVRVNGTRLGTELRGLWRHEFKKTGPDFRASFVGQPGGFTVTGGTGWENVLSLGGEVYAGLTESTDLTFSYDGRFGEGADHSLMGGVRYRF